MDVYLICLEYFGRINTEHGSIQFTIPKRANDSPFDSKFDNLACIDKIAKIFEKILENNLTSFKAPLA